MSGPTALLAALEADPVLAYSLLAAALLAAVSLVTAWLRLDLVALFRPRILLRVAGCVVLAFAMHTGVSQAAALGAPDGLVQLLLPLYRLPLYLVTLAYGPSVGLFTAVLYAAFQASGPMPGWNEVLLGLELVVLGWLAIYPSPRTDRWAGPFNALLAYALAWGTGGLALLEARSGAVTASGVWQQHASDAAGLLLLVVLLSAFGPGVYQRWFPNSRIAPRPSAAVTARPGAALLSLEMGDHRERPDLDLTSPELPVSLRRARPDRSLEPLPFHPEREPLG